MEKESASKMVTLVLRAIALAMSVAVVVLSALKVATTETLVTLLGMGLFGLALTSLSASDE